MPVAMNCCVSPLAIEGLAGVTAIDCSTGAVLVSAKLIVVRPVAAAATL